jgi:isopenicillin N synthase-like dioxygenase
MNFSEFISGRAQQPLPQSLLSDEKTLSDFGSLSRGLCQKVLELFALGLEVDNGSKFFEPYHPLEASDDATSGSILRLLYYPPLGPDYKKGIDIRAGAHSDYGSITLLFQKAGQSGLQILTQEGTWDNVPADKEGDILINIGDLLEYWTAGVLKSTIHRVTVPEGSQEERYNIAYFCHPLDKTALAPVPCRVVRERLNNQQRLQSQIGEDGRKAMTAKEHLHKRLADTYGWSREEIGAETSNA